ncbi:MAG: hypothetical protein ABI415_03960 [Flavitalea sp.]
MNKVVQEEKTLTKTYRHFSVTPAVTVIDNKKLEFFIDKQPVLENELEAKLLSLFTADQTKAIILRAEEGVPIEKAFA